MVSWNELIKDMPKNPFDGKLYWTNGEEILTEDKVAADCIADFLEDANFDVVTGFYDPKEDKKDNCIDDCTGMFYVTING